MPTGLDLMLMESARVSIADLRRRYGSIKALLEAAAFGEVSLMPQQMNAARALLEHEAPKLKRASAIKEDESFGAVLERRARHAEEYHRNFRLIDITPDPEKPE
jgi:hypothetical protein